MSRRSLFNHFPTKADLADTVTAQMSSAINYWAVHTDDETPAETLHAAARALSHVVTIA